MHMRRRCITGILYVLAAMLIHGAGQAQFTSVQSGNWNDNATWGTAPGVVPGAGDNVFIEATHTVIVDVNSSCNNLNISTTGVVAVGANVLTVNGKLRAYAGTAPGTSSSNPGATCITTGTGKVVFTLAGAITISGEWGGNPHSWRAEFDITGGGTATLGTHFSAGDIIIKNGTLSTTENIRPNKNAINTGTLLIETGAKLLLSTLSGIIQRTNTAGETCQSITVNGTLEFSHSTVSAFAVAENASNGTLAYTANNAQTMAPLFSSCKNLILGGTGVKTNTVAFSITNNGTARINGSGTCQLNNSGGTFGYGTNCTFICNSDAGFYDIDGSIIASMDIWPVANGPQNVTVLGNGAGNELRLSNSDFDRTIPGILSLDGGGLRTRTGAILRFANNAQIIRNTANSGLRNVGSGIFHFGAGGTEKVDVTINVPCIATLEMPPINGTLLNGKIGSFTINGDYTVDPSAGLQVRPVTDLIINSGKVILGNNDILYVDNSITGADANKYVVTSGINSGLRRPVSGSAVQFPIGKSTYNPLIISNGSGHNWSANVEDALVVTQTPFDLNVPHAVQRTWNISPSVNPPAAGADITFQYNQVTDVIPANFNTTEPVQVWHKESTYWLAAGNSMMPTALGSDNMTTFISGWTRFSPFAISTWDKPLPVSFISCSGRRKGNANELNWEMAAGVNADYDVQRSADGSAFTTLGTVYGNAFVSGSSTNRKYIFTDLNPAGVKQYYRIKVTGRTGSAAYSNIIVISERGQGPLSCSVAPNPASYVLNVSINILVKTTANLRIADMSGRICMQKTVLLQDGTNSFSYDIDSLPAGLYKLIVQAGDGTTQAAAFIKK